MSQTVAILGGGVPDLSAAHELAERGFQVRIFERKPVIGGKARSISVPGSAFPDHQPLPGEHGFRFFPGFYKHVTDTMRRIPYGARGNTFDNLTVATRILLARSGQAEITWLARSPETVADLQVFLTELFTPLGVPADELAYFVTRLLIVATSCLERRLAEFEQIAWWDFIAAPRMFHTLVSAGVTAPVPKSRIRKPSASGVLIASAPIQRRCRTVRQRHEHSSALDSDQSGFQQEQSAGLGDAAQ
jgi:uncharacterized protein with NAD-binding domain and iron-sulfur cluster